MEQTIPANLIFENAQLRIFYEAEVAYNKTARSIVIEGTRGGFLSLSNAIIYFLNDLEDTIKLHLIPYVIPEISFTIELDEMFEGVQFGIVLRKTVTDFVWKISETALCEVSTIIHSLGHINSELHFDYRKPADEITVYCVVA